MYKDEGTILPLWRFSNDFIKKKCINSVSWNRKYDDLFAISAGSSNKLEIYNDFFYSLMLLFRIQVDFFDQQPGLIVVYSLKNPENFEYKIETKSGCMCLEFNNEMGYLLCAGFYDGTVALYDMRYYHERNHKFCVVSGKDDRHSSPVWQVIQWTQNHYFYRLCLHLRLFF